MRYNCSVKPTLEENRDLKVITQKPSVPVRTEFSRRGRGKCGWDHSGKGWCVTIASVLHLEKGET